MGSKISGVLAGPRVEVTEDTPAPPDVPLDTTQKEEPVPVVETPPQQAEPPQQPAIPSAAPPDAVCAAAIDVARAAAVEVAGDAVGDHLGVEDEPMAGGHVVTHSFATREVGYVGWRWAVSVARAAGSELVTVDEVVLLPGGGALVAPAWVPWDQRMQPGDLGPGDLLPPAENDPRLVASYQDSGADDLPFDLHRDLGLGRPRVLSADGRADAAERWHDGDAGPAAPIAKGAPGRCVDCGFFVLLAGGLGHGFGACANEMAPDDGRVVALLHGCGAHSEQPTASTTAAATGMALEHEELELVDVSALPAADPA